MADSKETSESPPDDPGEDETGQLDEEKLDEMSDETLDEVSGGLSSRLGLDRVGRRAHSVGRAASVGRIGHSVAPRKRK